MVINPNLEIELRKHIIAPAKIKEIAGNISWLIQDILLARGITVLGAFAKEGKTFLTMDMIKCIITGNNFLGFPTNKTSVLVLDKDNDAFTLSERLEKMGLLHLTNLSYIHHFPFWLDDETHTHTLSKLVKEFNIGLVVFDALIRFHKKNENDASEMREVIHGLRTISNEGNCAVLVLHHNSKSEETRLSRRLRGSGDILGGIDNLLGLEKRETDEGASYHLSFVDGRHIGFEGVIKYKIVDSGESISLIREGGTLDTQSIVKLFLARNELSISDICNELNIADSEARRIISKLLNKQIIEAHSSAHNKRVYTLKVTTNIN